MWLPFALAGIALIATSCAGRTPPAQEADDEYYQPPFALPPAQESTVTVEPAAETGLVLVMSAQATSGDMDQAALGRTLASRLAGLTGCYGDAGGLEAGRGVVYALLDAEPSGEVSEVLVGHSEVRDRAFLDCLELELGAARLPASAEGAAIQAHLVFGASDVRAGRELFEAYQARTASAGQSEQPVRLDEVGRLARQCFERTFRGRRLEQGRLVLDLTVSDEGRIDEVEVVEDDFDGRLDVCVSSSVRHLQLSTDGNPPPRIRYPVILSQSEV